MCRMHRPHLVLRAGVQLLPEHSRDASSLFQCRLIPGDVLWAGVLLCALALPLILRNPSWCEGK